MYNMQIVIAKILRGHFQIASVPCKICERKNKIKCKYCR